MTISSSVLRPSPSGSCSGGATGSVLFGSDVSEPEGAAVVGAVVVAGAVVAGASGASPTTSPITITTTAAGSEPAFVSAVPPAIVVLAPASTSRPSAVVTLPAVVSTNSGRLLGSESDSPGARTSRTRFTS